MRVISRAFLLALILFATITIASEPISTDGSKIGITIMGAIVQADTDNNVALIKEESGKVHAIKKNHVVSNKYKVINITEKYIELITKDAKRYLVYQNKFANEFASFNKTQNGPQLDANDIYREDGFERNKGQITMTGMYRDNLVKQDLAKVLMQATAEPYMEGGSVIGFKLSQIDDGSIYSKSGLQNGDIVTGINNHALNSVAGSIALLRSLKNTERIDMEIRRSGSTMNMSISVLE